MYHVRIVGYGFVVVVVLSFTWVGNYLQYEKFLIHNGLDEILFQTFKCCIFNHNVKSDTLLIKSSYMQERSVSLQKKLGMYIEL